MPIRYRFIFSKKNRDVSGLASSDELKCVILFLKLLHCLLLHWFLWDLLGGAAAFGLMVEGCWQCLAYPASKIVNVLE